MMSIFIAVKSAADHLGKTVSHLFGWGFVFSVILLSAISTYGIFYVLYLPAPHHVKPVHFKFRTHGYSSNDRTSWGGYRKNEFTMSSVHLRFEEKNREGERILMRGQGYKVSLELNVPNSDVNKQLGMFMTELTFISKDHRTVGTSTRSALVPYSSNLIFYLTSLFDFFMIYSGWKQESHQLNIVLFENYIDDSYHPSELAEIVIYCRELQIYSANLHIETIYTGIRYYMYYWPITSAAIGIVSNICLGIILALWLYFKFCKKMHEHDAEVEEEHFEMDASYMDESIVDSELIEGEEDVYNEVNNDPQPQTGVERSVNEPSIVQQQRRHATLQRLRGHGRGSASGLRVRRPQTASLTRPSGSRSQARETVDESSQTGGSLFAMETGVESAPEFIEGVVTP